MLDYHNNVYTVAKNLFKKQKKVLKFQLFAISLPMEVTVFDIMQPPDAADYLTGSRAAASPQAFEGVRNRGVSRQPRPRLHKVQTMDSPANLRNIVKNRPGRAGKSSGIVTQERHYITALYARVNMCIMSVVLILIFRNWKSLLRFP